MKQTDIIKKRLRLPVVSVVAVFLIFSVGIVPDTADARKKGKSGHAKYSKREAVKQYYGYLRRRGFMRDGDATIAEPDGVRQDTGVLSAPYGEHNHPLSIKADSESNFYVKLQRLGDTESVPVMTMFIKSGETINAKAPSGNYEIKYASGNSWYGEEYLFWEGTRFYKTDAIFEFNVETSPTEDGILYSYSGYTVELVEQVSGNLETAEIPANEF